MNHLIFLLISLCAGMISLPAHAAQTFKIGSLAPTGSVWIEEFRNFTEEVKQKTGGQVRFKVYPGGVMGDDKAMLRKMRVGQLHGGGFTMTGISSVVPDFRVMAIPFLFESYGEVDHVRRGLLPTFRKLFRAKGFELVAMTEVGFIYAMSTSPVTSLTELQQSRNWTPSGDPVSQEYLKALSITPVQLTIPDVLSSLQSGLIDTVYNSLYGSIVLQWFTKANHIVNLPYGYAYGAFVLDAKRFDKLTAEQQSILREAAQTHFDTLLKATRDSNRKSREVLQQQGVSFHDIDEATRTALHAKRDTTVKALIPASISQAIFDDASELLQESRTSQKKQ